MSGVITCVGLIFIMQCQMPEPPRPTVVVCPSLVPWEAAEQAAAADALAALPAGHPLRRMATVTVKQRDLVRRCRARGKR